MEHERSQVAKLRARPGMVETSLPEIPMPMYDARGNVSGTFYRTMNVARFEQDPETSTEIAAAIKKHGNFDQVPKEEWKRIDKADTDRRAKQANTLKASDDMDRIRAEFEARHKYFLRQAQLMAGNFQGLSTRDIIEILALNPQMPGRNSFSEWARITASMPDDGD